MTLGVPKPDDHLYQLPLGQDAQGRDQFAPPYASVIVTGAPRTGKTRNVAIPAIAFYPGSCVVVSVRDDVFVQTHEARARRGPVAVFDPAGITAESSMRTGWDMLGQCKDLQFAIEVAQALAEGNLPTASASGNDWTFWNGLARKVVAPCLLAASTDGYYLEDATRWVKTQEEFEVQALLQAMGEKGEKALEMIKSVWAFDSRTTSNVYATADAMISAFEAPNLATAVNSGINVQEFVNRPSSTLYVIAPATKQGVYAPIVTALVGTALDAAVEKAERTNEPARILVILDEAGNIGKVPELKSRATTSMGFGITMLSCWHGVSQLNRTYNGPDEAQTILASHHVVLALRNIDSQTATFIDGIVGEEPDMSLPRGKGIARLRKVPPGHAIGMIGGDDPQLFKLPSLEDPLLRLELDARPGDLAPMRPVVKRTKNSPTAWFEPNPDLKLTPPDQDWRDPEVIEADEYDGYIERESFDEPPENPWPE